jgi:quinol monooxygenase YgiN
MSDGVIVTVRWCIRPDRSDDFERSLRAMFPVTKTHKGFRSITLVASHDAAKEDARDYLLIEEWDDAGTFEAYGKFRVDTGDTAMLLDMTVDYPQVTIWSGSPLAHAEA